MDPATLDAIIRRNWSMIIKPSVRAAVLDRLASADPDASFTLLGRDLVTGLPTTVHVRAAELTEFPPDFLPPQP